MKKIIAYTTVFASFFLLISCGFGNSDKPDKLNESQFTTQTAANLYQVDIPNYMKPATDLNDDASLQFQNIYKETYIAIIDEDKDDFVEAFIELGEYDESLSPAGNYRTIQMNYFTETMSGVTTSTPKEVTLNGLRAEQVELRGSVPGVDYEIFYLMTFIEGRDNVYMMMEWTLQEYENKFKDTFYQIGETFREL